MVATDAAHALLQLPSVVIDSYNVELRDKEGFVGDRASNRAFRAILDDWRERLERVVGEDPLGEVPSREFSKKKLDKLLVEGDPEAAGVVQSAVEDFAQELAAVVRRFLRLKGWRDTERIVVGGGFRESRIGELAIGRASVLLKGEGIDISLVPIRNHPDEAGLIGACHLAPAWIFKGHDGLLAIDIGGTNIRAGIVRPNLKKAPDVSKAEVWKALLWRYRDDDPPPTRDGAVDHLADMVGDLIKAAEKEGLSLAPFIGVGCPGLINEDGSIERGGQNLPGDWESSRFNLPERLRDAIPEIEEHETMVVMHNDAVVQGLSEAPFMQDVERWGVLTIGTGLGNARFTNRAAERGKNGERRSPK
ncbi:MAG TPA: ROK family protein [Beijerinckiaceae bacterium]|jgi:predicted NBD/HSP70 family sugar kinase|nr:ROK family protein [Beijerinckiaceae bacterium]